MVADAVVEAFDPFITLCKGRAGRIADRMWEYVLSEESFRFDYALALGTGDPLAVFAEFPYDHDRAQKADLFVDDGAGSFLELKYFRPIPSGGSTPLTQHLGSLVADFLKLRHLTNSDRRRFEIVAAEGAFRTHLDNSLLADIWKVRAEFHVDPRQLAPTALRKVLDSLPRLKDPLTTVRLRTERVAHAGPSQISLLRILAP